MAPDHRHPVLRQVEDRRPASSQILIPIGIGRFYIGDTKIGVLQLVLSLRGVGIIWAFIDGIIMLATDSKDASGYMLRT